MNVLGCGGSGGSNNPVGPVVSPQIVSISPTTGGPGTSVSIQGRGFGTVQGTSIVSYSGVTVSPTSWSENLINVTIPSTSVNNGVFIVTVAGVASNQSPSFNVSNPIITSISSSGGSSSGSPGSSVVISGQYFGMTPGTVSFNGQTASVVSWNQTSISCIVPNTTGAVLVVVTIDGNKQSNAVSFTVAVPTISSISPNSAKVGASITINGSGFGSAQSLGNGSVTVGGQSATINYWSDSYIQTTVPSAVTGVTANVVVTVNGKQSNTMALTMVPTLRTITSRVTKNDVVTITGSNFGDNIGSISMTDNTSAISPTLWTDTQIQFKCPISSGFLGSDKSETVTIVTSGGQQASTLITVY